MNKECQIQGKPFEGIKVLEFCWAGVGPFSLNNLAYYGAEVIKIETTLRPDITRTGAPYKDNIPGLERSATFAWTNPVKKYDITLNLNHPRGIEIAKRLVARADVVGESFTAGKMEKFGLGYEDLKKIRPDIIMFRTCGFGQTGPLSKQPSTGFSLTTLTGFNSLCSWPDRPSSPVSAPYTDFISPLFGGLALVAALDYRRRTGKGQCIDLPQHEAALNFVTPIMLDFDVNQRELTPTGNQSANAAPHGPYRCKGDDRWCAIAVSTDEEWNTFCEVIGNPAWTKEQKFSTLLNRLKNHHELDTLVEEWTINFEAEEVMVLMQVAGLPAGVVSNMQDLFEDPQLKYYHHFHELDHPAMGKCAFYQGPGFRLSEADYEVARPPLLGEHNKYVYTEILGISEDDYAKWMKDGVFD
jgi:crotonobetainyl-CoA:carnitine CoA-transferase CaiB-like acyl-CoA transferase